MYRRASISQALADAARTVNPQAADPINVLGYHFSNVRIAVVPPHQRGGKRLAMTDDAFARWRGHRDVVVSWTILERGAGAPPPAPDSLLGTLVREAGLDLWPPCGSTTASDGGGDKAHG